MEKSKRITAIMLAFAMVLTMSSAQLFGQTMAKSKRGTYKLEVNKSRCVVVAYKKKHGKWKYVRTMLCSPGTGGRTPSGHFRLGGKQRWGVLMGPCYGQYCCNITGSILFHSVWYNSVNKASQNAAEFNRLGRPASHGCVRLSTIDAKWIYDKCKSGTKIRISYNTRVPKGRPPKFYSGSGWDPTDPDGRNPYNKLRKARIKVSSKTLAFGGSYKVKKLAKAYNPNALEDISYKIKARVLRNGRWKRMTKLPTGKSGKVKVQFQVRYGYCKSNHKIVTFRIADKSKPVIKAENYQVMSGEANAVKGMTAKQKDGTKRTGAVKVTITDPAGKKIAKKISFVKAEKFVFEKEGSYKVTYVVANKNYKNKKAKKTITVTVTESTENDQES